MSPQNNEHTEFARWRFSRLTGSSKAREAIAVEHYRPAPQGRLGHAARIIVCLAAAAFVGWLAAQGV